MQKKPTTVSTCTLCGKEFESSGYHEDAICGACLGLYSNAQHYDTEASVAFDVAYTINARLGRRSVRLSDE